jgi:effector-binding domain-containing protein
MEYQVNVHHVDSLLTAVIKQRARHAELSKVVPQLCGEVWNFFNVHSLPRPGRHVALYLNGVIDLEVGVETTTPISGDGRVVSSSTPAGLAATATHWGSYDKLHEAHEAIRAHCQANGLTMTGVDWEIYGHWDDDPSKVRTDIFYLLEDKGTPHD